MFYFFPRTTHHRETLAFKDDFMDVFGPYFQPAQFANLRCLSVPVRATVESSLEEYFQHQDLPALQAVFGGNHSARRMDGTTPTAK